jgi:hypothetical protein
VLERHHAVANSETPTIADPIARTPRVESADSCPPTLARINAIREKTAPIQKRFGVRVVRRLDALIAEIGAVIARPLVAHLVQAFCRALRLA